MANRALCTRNLYNSPHFYTFHWIHSLSAINSVDPFPAQAIPLTKVVDAPNPIPNVKHLQKLSSCY